MESTKKVKKHIHKDFFGKRLSIGHDIIFTDRVTGQFLTGNVLKKEGYSVTLSSDKSTRTYIRNGQEIIKRGEVL